MNTYNYTSKTWTTLPNLIPSGNGNNPFSISNSLSTNNISQLLGINSTNPMLVQLTKNSTAEAIKDFKTDYLYVSCDQLSNPQYQTVAGSSEMHVTQSTTGLYSIFDTALSTVFTTTFYNYNISYYTGIFTDNFTVEPLATSDNTQVTYSPFQSLPCNSILKLYQIIANGSLNDIPFTTDLSGSNSANCEIVFNANTTTGTDLNYEVIARNTWESDARSTESAALSIQPLITSACHLWAIQHNETYPYIIPKNDSTNPDPQYRTCADYFDNFYYFNQTYNTLLNDKLNITDRPSFDQVEADYASMKFAEEKLNTITYLSLDNVMASGLYSQILLQNPLGENVSINQYWANISTTQDILNATTTNTLIIQNINTTTTSIKNDTNNILTIVNNIYNYITGWITTTLGQIWNATQTINTTTRDINITITGIANQSIIVNDNNTAPNAVMSAIS